MKTYDYDRRKTADLVDDSERLELMVGGPDKAFRLMRLWEDAYGSLQRFVNEAKSERYSDKAIKFYVEKFIGERMPKVKQR